MNHSFANAFNDLPVLVTGHTGFKGSWLTIWLTELGARVIGYSLPQPPTAPSNFGVSHLSQKIVDIRGDVRDYRKLREVVETHRPELIFHLAAQPLVLPAYEDPKETFDTNVGGTVNVLEAVRQSETVRAVVCITTDKVYENREWVYGYREIDRLGGHDPYSSSKAMAELAIASYRSSFFNSGSPAVASTRAGNVIGGGDFADFRLVPDCMRALMAGEPIQLRNPGYVRPWQHVLESLSGYLWLAVKLLEEGQAFAEPWNFAPLGAGNVTAQMIAEKAIELWGSGSCVHIEEGTQEKETETLHLNWDKAASRLRWQPVYQWQEALAVTVDWFKTYQEQQAPPNMYGTCVAQISAYTGQAQKLGLVWACE